MSTSDERPSSTTAANDIFPAAMTGNVKRVRELLDAGVSPDHFAPLLFGVRRPLHYAAESGHTSVVALLLERGASVDSKDEINATPLMHAFMKGGTGFHKKGQLGA